MVAAGADGSIQIKWHRSKRQEFSLFIEPNAVLEFLFVDNDRVFDGEIRDTSTINDYLNRLIE